MEQQDQQPNQQLKQTFSDEVKREKNKRIKIALLALAAVLFAVVGILLLRGLSQAPISPMPAVIQQTPPPVVQPQVLDTSDWQTYRNDEFGFEVRYPTDWNISDADVESKPEVTTFMKEPSGEGFDVHSRIVRM